MEINNIANTVIDLSEATKLSEQKAKVDWKTKPQIAGHFKCSIRTITKLMRRRILPFVKIGKLVRFDSVECDRAFATHKSKSILIR